MSKIYVDLINTISSSLFNAVTNIKKSLNSKNSIDISNDINLSIINLKDSYNILYDYMLSIGINIKSPISKIDTNLIRIYNIIDNSIKLIESLNGKIEDVLTKEQRSLLNTMYNLYLELLECLPYIKNE